MTENKNELLNQIVNCGSLIEKKREHFKKIDVNEEVLLKGLSEEEQKTLSELLAKLKQYWADAHKARHEKG